MLDTRALLALALAPSERAYFAERCYAGGVDALENEDSRRAALLFAVVALSNPSDSRGWHGLAHVARRVDCVEAGSGLELLSEAFAAGPPLRKAGP
ncbi:MAG: hypothetical protein ACOY0T_41315 [Myxococcota bacterium]